MSKCFLIIISLFLFYACTDEKAEDAVAVSGNGFVFSLRTGSGSAPTNYRTLDVFLLKVMEGRPDSASMKNYRFSGTEQVVLKDLEKMEYCVYAVANLDTSVFSIELGGWHLVDICRKSSSVELPELMVGKTTIDVSQEGKTATFNVEKFVGGVKVIIKNQAELAGVEKMVVEIENAPASIGLNGNLFGADMPARIAVDGQLHYCFPTYDAVRGHVLVYLTGKDVPEALPFYCKNRIEKNKKLELGITVKLLQTRSAVRHFTIDCEDQVSEL